jgi:hypothetical protein
MNFKNNKTTIIIYIALIASGFFILYKFSTHKSPEEIAFVNSDEQLPSNQYQSAENLFNDFKSNKVAFDRRHNDKLMEFQGTILKITNEWGCSSLIIQATDNPFETIFCNNCPADVDKWSDEVVKLTVGNQVTIKGYYSSSSSESEMSFYKCRVIN